MPCPSPFWAQRHPRARPALFPPRRHPRCHPRRHGQSLRRCPPPPQVGVCKIPLALCLKNACLPGSCSCACFALQAPCHVGLKALYFTALQQQGTSFLPRGVLMLTADMASCEAFIASWPLKL